MPSDLLIFVSHSSGDNELVDALLPMLDAALEKKRRGRAIADRTVLRSGDKWQDDIAAMLSHCNAALVLLTSNVLARPEWVRYETAIVSHRARGEQSPFSLWFAFEEGVDRLKVQQTLAPVEIGKWQLLGTAVAQGSLDRLVAELCDKLYAIPVEEPDPVREQLQSLLARAHWDFCKALARKLDVRIPDIEGDRNKPEAVWLTARAALARHEHDRRIDDVLGGLLIEEAEKRTLLVNWLAPLWVNRASAQMLLQHAPTEDGGPGAGMVLVRGNRVGVYTGEMYVRRAFGIQQGFKIPGVAVPAGGDLVADITASLCAWARASGWVRFSTSDAVVLEELNRFEQPIFVPLDFLPDGPTCEALCKAFPCVLFIAPCVATAAPAGSDPFPRIPIDDKAGDPAERDDAYLELERLEHAGWRRLR